MTCDLCLVPAVFGGIINNNNFCNNINHYMANPVLGKSLCSDWFFLGQDFAVRIISMIGSFSVRILQYAPFPWKWSNPYIFVLEQSRQIQNLQPR